MRSEPANKHGSEANPAKPRRHSEQSEQAGTPKKMLFELLFSIFINTKKVCLKHVSSFALLLHILELVFSKPFLIGVTIRI